MALERTHTLELSVVSNLLILKDTTPIGDYNSNGITDPVSEAENIYIVLYNEIKEEIARLNILSYSSDLRSADGAKVPVIDFGIGGTLEDGIYVSEMIYTFSSTEYPSESKDCLYSAIKNKVGLKSLTSNWVDSKNPISLSSYSKYTVKLKKALDELTSAAENGLYDEFKELYNKLNGML